MIVNLSEQFLFENMDSDFEELYNEKINEADKLIDILKSLDNLKGVTKLKKLVVAERTFLVKIANTGVRDAKHLSTTNLTHFEALVTTVLGLENCVSVLQPFTFKVGGKSKRLIIDVVRNQGREWIKVTARNPTGLVMSCLGDSTFGSRTIIDQAEDIMQCALQNQIFYVPPKVIFKFSLGVYSALATKLEKLGIEVAGDLLPTSCSAFCESSDEETEQEKDIGTDRIASEVYKKQSCEGVRLCETHPIIKLNLDITALIAYVSDMTNGGSCSNFVQEPLTLQAQSEKEIKVKDNLDNLFEGKSLYSCETAVTRFKEILEVVGGEKERERAKIFLERITVVPDCISERVMKLKKGGQIKDRPKAVFGTGDSMQAITVSANWGFCRSAEHQGVHLTTFLHEPRALSEQASQLSLRC